MLLSGAELLELAEPAEEALALACSHFERRRRLIANL